MTTKEKVEHLKCVVKALGQKITVIKQHDTGPISPVRLGVFNITDSDLAEADYNHDRLMMLYRLKINHVNMMLGRTSSYTEDNVNLLPILGGKNTRKWLININKLKLT